MSCKLRDDLLCSIKCSELGCAAFYVDQVSRECKTGLIAEGGMESTNGITVYRRVEKEPNGKYLPFANSDWFSGMTLFLGGISYNTTVSNNLHSQNVLSARTRTSATGTTWITALRTSSLILPAAGHSVGTSLHTSCGLDTTILMPTTTMPAGARPLKMANIFRLVQYLVQLIALEMEVLNL